MKEANKMREQQLEKFQDAYNVYCEEYNNGKEFLEEEQCDIKELNKTNKYKTYDRKTSLINQAITKYLYNPKFAIKYLIKYKNILEKENIQILFKHLNNDAFIKYLDEFTNPNSILFINKSIL